MAKIALDPVVEALNEEDEDDERSSVAPSEKGGGARRVSVAKSNFFYRKL